MSDINLSDTLTTLAAEVEHMLEAILSQQSLPDEYPRPERLLAAMRHACLAGGKRLRPFLLIETARLFDQSGSGIMRAAAALELVHCYSLVHDDLPAMDDDDLRRGRPTVHKAFDEATAILAGDSLLTLAFDVMADAPTHHDPLIRAQLVTRLARYAGLGGMAGGQMLDLQAEQSAQPLDQEHILRLQAMKTGALLLYAVEAGARLAGATQNQLADLELYARHLGAIFQIADDLLDVEADAATLGKATGKDAEAGKATLVQLLGVEGARAEIARLTSEALQALQSWGAAADLLRAGLYFAGNRSS
jgi:farnesyl diphosphate synthase